MANEILVKVGTQITFADHATDFVGGAAKDETKDAYPYLGAHTFAPGRVGVKASKKTPDRSRG